LGAAEAAVKVRKAGVEPKYPFIVVRYDVEHFNVYVLGGKVVAAIARAGVSDEEIEALAIAMMLANGWEEKLFQVLSEWVTLVPLLRE
jgi:hypothetical protein